MANITRYSVVCNKHFVPDSFLDVRKNPTLEPFNARWSQDKLRKASERQQRRADNTAVDHAEDQVQEASKEEAVVQVPDALEADVDLPFPHLLHIPPSATYSAGRRHRSTAAFVLESNLSSPALADIVDPGIICSLSLC